MAPEVEGVAQVVEWRQVGEYAAVTDFVWLRRINLVLDDPKCGTNTKGEVCLSGGSCNALSAPLGGHLAFTAQEHKA